MKYLMIVLVLFSSLVLGDEVSLGLWSHHRDRTVYEDKCVNEKHNLLAYTRDRVTIGGYKNSHCRQSYLFGLNGNIWKSIDYSISLVSGYPKSMHLIDEFIVIPMVHYTYISQESTINIYHMEVSPGVRFSYIPTVLFAVGYVIKF